MADLSTRFRAADGIPVDGIVEDVRRRLADPSLVAIRSIPTPPRRRAARVLTIAAAILIVLVAFGLAWRLVRGLMNVVPATPILVTPPEGWSPPGAVGRHGALYVADCLHARIVRVALDGRTSEVVGAGAGGYTNGDAGDEGPANEAHFGCPASPAWDAAGRLFIADELNDHIRVVDQNGIVHLLAGDRGNDLGDGGPASQAELLQPSTVAFDAAGNLYISDRDNERIRKITLDGTITTIAGNGVAGYSGDGGPATDAMIDTADAIAIDAAGNVYFSDANNNRVRMVDANGIITTVAGGGRSLGDDGPAVDAKLADPNGLVFDVAGDLFIADYDHGRIRKVDPSGTITTVAGTGSDRVLHDVQGSALETPLGAPIAIALAPDGRHLYIVQDVYPTPVSVLDLETGRIETLANIRSDSPIG
jgi:sugar lactone lactonase YvrE